MVDWVFSLSFCQLSYHLWYCQMMKKSFFLEAPSSERLSLLLAWTLGVSFGFHFQLSDEKIIQRLRTLQVGEHSGVFGKGRRANSIHMSVPWKLRHTALQVSWGRNFRVFALLSQFFRIVLRRIRQLHRTGLSAFEIFQLLRSREVRKGSVHQ